MYDNVHGMGVDPRSIAQRIMEVLAARQAGNYHPAIDASLLGEQSAMPCCAGCSAPAF